MTTVIQSGPTTRAQRLRARQRARLHRWLALGALAALLVIAAWWPY